ncbi:MAG: hypothetical protein ACKV2U_04520 [Bryobacteraceae bacterium]
MAALSVACAIALEGQKKPMDPTRTIDLAAPNRTFVLGASIPVGIRYTNRSAVEIQFRDPRKTWEVQLSNGTVSLPFGKIIRSVDNGIMSWSVEDAETIRLAPNANFTFQYDAGKRWPEAFRPGRNGLQIKDLTSDAVTLESKRIEVAVEFTADTVPALLAILDDPEATPGSQQFAVQWLQAVYPQHVTPAATRAWWDSNRSSPAVAEAIARINRDAAAQ